MLIEDECAALDFDLTCAARLLFYDMGKERRMAEMLGMGQLTSTFGGALSAEPSSKVERW